MGQRIRPREARGSFTAGGRIRALLFDDAEQDPDILINRYDMLRSAVNDSAPIIVAGDELIEPLTMFYCRRCGGTRSPVAHSAVNRSRTGRGTVFVLRTLRRVTPAAAPVVTVVLAAPSEPNLGRLPTPVPNQLLTECRAHGVLTIPTRVALTATRKSLRQTDTDGLDTPVPRKWV